MRAGLFGQATWGDGKSKLRPKLRIKAQQAFAVTHPHAAGLDWETLKRDGWQRLSVPEQYAPFAEGKFPTPSGKCEFSSARLAAQGHDPLPTFVPPRESVRFLAWVYLVDVLLAPLGVVAAHHGMLSFLPALALGPVVEHLLLY